MSAVTTLNNNPDSLWKILPRSATQLERDLLKSTSSDEFRRVFGLIPEVKREIEHPDWLPFLLIEYGAAEAAKLFKDWPALLEYIKMIRGKQGTPFAVEEMAKLMRYAQNLIWEEPEATVHFPEFQLALGEYEPSLARLCTLRKLVNTVKPARGRFRRLFHGWDERQMQWDDDEFGSFWDSESGVDILPLGLYGDYRSDDQFIVSLGQSFVRNVTMPQIELSDSADIERGYPLVLVERHFLAQTTSEFYPLLDTEAFDGDIIEDPGVNVGTREAQVPFLEFMSSTIWEQGYPVPVAADAGFPVSDFDGFDGSVETVPSSLFNRVALFAEPELDSTQLDEVAHVTETDAGEESLMDTDELDGGVAAESTFALYVDLIKTVPVALRLHTHRGDNIPFGIYKDTGHTQPATQDGDLVAVWRDELSGSGVRAVQTNPALRMRLRFRDGVPVLSNEVESGGFSLTLDSTYRENPVFACVGITPNQDGAAMPNLTNILSTPYTFAATGFRITAKGTGNVWGTYGMTMFKPAATVLSAGVKTTLAVDVLDADGNPVILRRNGIVEASVDNTQGISLVSDIQIGYQSGQARTFIGDYTSIVIAESLTSGQKALVEEYVTLLR